MNAVTQTLLAGVALGALATAPALAVDAPHFHVVALHAGRIVDKTKVREPGRQHLTYTGAVTTSVSAAALHKKVILHDTFTKFSSNTASSWECGNPPTKINISKKATYGRAGTTTVVRNLHCTEGPSIFYGDTYKLKDPNGDGQTDRFVSTLIGKFARSGQKYNATLNLDVNVPIGQ
jgi:hypothetical protein